MISLRICVLLLLCFQVYSLTLQREQFVFDPKILVLANSKDDCDPTTVPVMADFDMKKFSGKWFELSKTVSGYIDVSDGVWKIEGSNASSSHTFRFSGRDNNQHCIRPLKGTMSASDDPPGSLLLKYKTYSTHVEENIRVLFTDYTSVAVIYTCMHHVHDNKEHCHAAGLFGAVWTRRPHVTVDVFDKAAKYLEMACLHKATLLNRNLIGPCRIDDLDYRIDDFPAPDYCYQPIDLGSCGGNLQRYYFDPKEKLCKTFQYSGCDGNKNNFMSMSECQKKCVVSTSKDPVCPSIAKCGLHCSPCCVEDNDGCVQCRCDHLVVDDTPHCEPSPNSCLKGCEPEALYPGCYFCKCKEEREIVYEKRPFACNEVLQKGNCNFKFERYYYDVLAGKCEAFDFTGCHGNNNNFKSLRECKETCGVSDDVVVLSPIWNNEASATKYSLLSTLLAIFVLILLMP